MPELSDRARLEAGGLLRVGADVGSDLAMDTVDARGYTSPALLDRTVVRLVPDAIARGVDTEMQLLSFRMVSHADDIAIQRRRALGFPGATLVIDPDRARYALDVMREFKKHRKRITSKPGHAKDGFDEIGERLSRQVPHFLPSYYEEVARSFAHAGNLTYAGTFFDRARTAEQEFGLEVDEERRAEAFLEFALLGALTVKSIQSYGKEVQRLAGADKAYERMVQLATRRTLGGVAPWASLPKDLRGLAKAAKRNVALEDERFLREISSAASLKRAPQSFWTEYRDAWISLAKADPVVRGRLLEMFPNGGKTRYSWRADESGFSESWLDLLFEAGALDALWSTGPEEARPSGGRAAWFSRLQDWASAGDPAVLQLVRKAAPSLIADGAPLKVSNGGWYKPVDIDLLETVLEAKVPWTLEGGHTRVDLTAWAKWKEGPPRFGAPGEHRPKDPILASRDEAVKALLRGALDAAFGNVDFEGIAATMDGLKELRRDWLAERIRELSGPGLASTDYALGRLESNTTANHFAEFPELVAELGAADVGRSLAATLRDGIHAEWVWPAWEESSKALELAKGEAAPARVQWPYVLRSTPRKLAVLGEDGVIATFDLKHGDGKAHPQIVFFVGGSALVSFTYWGKGGRVEVAYWTHDPKDTFEPVQRWNRYDSSFPYVDGDAIVIGTTRFTKGDRSIPELTPQYHDAERSWVVVDGKLREQDRKTGAATTEGAPGFLQRSLHSASYHPVSREGALAGVVDGQYGLRRDTPKVGATDDDDDGEESLSDNGLITLAGDRFLGQMLDGAGSHAPAALIRMPGRTGIRAVMAERRWRSGKYVSQVLVTQPDGPRVSLQVQDPDGALPPLTAWHYYRPRDAAGSAALAKVTDAVAAGWMADAARPKVAGVTDAALADAVAEVVDQARALRDRVTKLLTARSTGGVARGKVVARLGDEDVMPALQNLRHYYTWGASSVSQAIESLGRFLTEGENGEEVTYSRLEPTSWIGQLRGIVVNVGRPGGSAVAPKLVAAVKGFVASGLAGPLVRTGQVTFSKRDLPWITLVDEEDDDGKTVKVPAAAWRHDEDGLRLFVTSLSEEDGDDDKVRGPWTATFVQHEPKATTFRDLVGGTLTQVRASRDDDPAWVEAWLAEHAARGEWKVTRADVDSFAAATGVNPTDAAVVLLGFPTEIEKEQREELGLKHAEVKNAVQRLRNTAFEEKLALLAARGGDLASSAWDDGAPARVAAAWTKAHGRVVAVDEALRLLAGKEVRGSDMLDKIANHASWTALREDAKFSVDDTGDPHIEGDGFTVGVAQSLVTAVGWLVLHVPVGHPLLADLGEIVAHARTRIGNPNAWYGGPRWYHYEDKDQKVAQTWFDALPGRAVATKTDDDDNELVHRKVIGAVSVTRSKTWTRTAFQRTTLDDSGRDLLRALAKLSGGDDDSFVAFEILCDAAMDRLVARITTSPVPAGKWEHNPLLSAPDLVANVAKKKKLSKEAAAAWLQTMSLVELSKKSVCEWNGWAPRVYDSAMAELVEAGLVIAGKRTRAGREHFLPGGWVDPKSEPPYEQWKLPLYGAKKDGALPLGAMVPVGPLHELFDAAWARCESGDGPKFEEVRR